MPITKDTMSIRMQLKIAVCMIKYICCALTFSQKWLVFYGQNMNRNAMCAAVQKLLCWATFVTWNVTNHSQVRNLFYSSPKRIGLHEVNTGFNWGTKEKDLAIRSVLIVFLLAGSYMGKSNEIKASLLSVPRRLRYVPVVAEINISTCSLLAGATEM